MSAGRPQLPPAALGAAESAAEQAELSTPPSLLCGGRVACGGLASDPPLVCGGSATDDFKRRAVAAGSKPPKEGGSAALLVGTAGARERVQEPGIAGRAAALYSCC